MQQDKFMKQKTKKNPITSLVCEFIGGGELSKRVCVWGVNGVNADCYCTLIVIFHIFSCLVSFKHGCSISVKIKQTLLGWAVTPGRLMCIQLSPPHLKMHIFKCMHKLGIAHVSLLHFYKKKEWWIYYNPVKYYTGISYYTYTLKSTDVAHLGISDCAGSYCASIMLICVLIHFHNMCLIFIHFLPLSVNRNICFSMHWHSLGDAVINVFHLAPARLHSLDMFFFFWEAQSYHSNSCLLLLIYHMNMPHYRCFGTAAIHFIQGWKIW